MATASDIGSLFNGAAALLEFGPIGLAGSMLVLSVVALLLGSFTPAKERFLKFFLATGAICFVAALVAQFLIPDRVVHFRVDPHDIAAFSDLPRPAISVNSQKLEPPFIYKVHSDVYAVVDVSQTIDLAKALRYQRDAQSNLLERYSEAIDGLRANVANVVQVTDQIRCGGGFDDQTSTPAFFANLKDSTAELLVQLEASQASLSVAHARINALDPQAVDATMDAMPAK